MRGNHILHKQAYNTEYDVSAIPDEICGEIRRQPYLLEIQQEPVVPLLLEDPLEQNSDVLSLPTTYSSADFLKRLVKWYVRRGIRVECFQTDSGFEFTNRFSKSRRDLSTLFETSAAQLAAHVTSSCVPIRPGTTLRRATASIRRCDSESRRRKR